MRLLMPTTTGVSWAGVLLRTVIFGLLLHLVMPSPAPILVPTPMPTIVRDPDHELDFRGCSDSSPTSDTGIAGAGITATAVHGATCTDEGMEFDGVDDYLNLTSWEFGGEPMTVEAYVKFDASAATSSWQGGGEGGEGRRRLLSVVEVCM